MLAVNAAQDATDLVAKLRAYHNSAQTTEGKKEYSMYALPQSLRIFRRFLGPTLPFADCRAT